MLVVPQSGVKQLRGSYTRADLYASGIISDMFDLQQTISFIKKHFKVRDLLFISLIICLFFVTRLVKLDRFPIFSDEGIYVRWAKVAWHDASWRFISLTDGRQPLQTWATIPFLKLFPSNALLAGRMFAVTSGFVGLVGIFSLLFILFGKSSAYVGSFFYLFTPYLLFYNRIALVDSAVNTAFIWILFFSILLARYIRLDISLLFGLVAGLSLLTKSSVRIFIGFGTLASILFFERNWKKFITKLVNFGFVYLIVLALSLVIYNVQRLSPFFHFVAEKNKTFIMTIDEFLKSPFSVFSHNLKNIPIYAFWEMGFVLGFIGIIGLILLYKKNWRLFFFFTLYLLGSYIGISLFARVLFPRYVIFISTFFLIFATYAITQLKNKIVVTTLLILYILSVSYFDYTILFDYAHIPFPEIDRGQYIEGWTAGWGVEEIMSYSRERSKEKPVIILAEGDFGLVGDVLETYVKPGDKISIKGYWPLDERQLYANQKELGKNYVYVVFSQKLTYPENWPVRLIKKYPKPGNTFMMYFLELTK